MALALFWGGMLLSIAGIMFDKIVLLVGGILVMFCGVLIWKERQ